MITLAEFEATKIRDVTVLHPISAVALVVAGALMVKMQRKTAILPFFAVAMLLPFYERIAIMKMDFFVLRILTIIGVARLYVRNELYFETKIDKLVGLLVLASSIVPILLWRTVHSITLSAAGLIDVLLGYLLIRSMVRDFDDVERVIKLLLFLSVILSAFLLYEKVSHRNPYHIFVGVPEISMIREGRLRAQACFGHPIMAGTFGALVLPLFAYLWKVGAMARPVALAGVIASAAIVYASASSGPVLSYIAAIVGIAMFPLRRTMGYLWKGAILALILLHIVMKAPVWELIARIGVVGGSTAYHRYFLLDSFIRRFGEWWLLGTKSTEHWSPYLQMWDTTNEYVKMGVGGGLITLGLMLLLIIRCFGAVGTAVKASADHRRTEYLCWSLGVMLFTHAVTFMGASYFAQINIMWLFTIAGISIVCERYGTDRPNVES